MSGQTGCASKSAVAPARIEFQKFRRCPGPSHVQRNPIMYVVWGGKSNIFRARGPGRKKSRSQGVRSPDWHSWQSGNLTRFMWTPHGGEWSREALQSQTLRICIFPACLQQTNPDKSIPSFHTNSIFITSHFIWDCWCWLWCWLPTGIASGGLTCWRCWPPSNEKPQINVSTHTHTFQWASDPIVFLFGLRNIIGSRQNVRM